MACPGLETITDQSVIGILSYPNLCDFYFYAKLMAAFFVILSFILFKRDEDKLAKGNMISSMGVAAIATIFISGIGTLLSIIPREVFIEIMVAGFIFIVLWLIKK